MGWNQVTRDRLELEIKRRVHKLSIRASTGELQGPELESAILDVIWKALQQNEQRGNVLEVTP